MYLERAGYNGYTEGFRLLSFMYREGEYVQKNENLARYYEKLAVVMDTIGGKLAGVEFPIYRQHIDRVGPTQPIDN